MPSSPDPTPRAHRVRTHLTSTPAKLSGFAVVLVTLFAAAALAGAAIDPDRDAPGAPHGGDARTATGGAHAGSEENPSVLEDRTAVRDADKQAHPLRGLAVAENGLRLVVEDRELSRGRTETVRFRVVDERGLTVRDFDVEHTKRMHLIVVRRDLRAFQHLHPFQRQDGSWWISLRLPLAGSYRLFADFSREGEPFTLASDLDVDGRADLRALPAPAQTARSDGGYEVRKQAGRTRPGVEASSRFTISKDGETVKTESYLGAGGHLVALREGDLAFLHVHPTEHSDGMRESHGDDASIAFAATLPTTGRYRLFLQFKHDDTVQTVAFTQEVR